jgi:hypothetical protein
MNGLLPLMVFIGILRRKFAYILTGLIFYVVVYYLYGVKAPVLYMLFSGGFAYFLRRSSGFAAFYKSIYYMLLSIFIFAWIEFWVFDYSLVEDFVVRRIYYVGSYLIGAYFDALSSTDFSWMSGLVIEGPASMYIGEDFLGLPGANANTNTFLYFLLQYGIFGYLFSIALVGVVLLLLNSLRSKSDVFVFLSLMYAVLVLEQSATTALLSSGIGVISTFFFFSCVNKDRHAC